MKIYLAHEDDDGRGSPFVGYFATKLEATRALRQAIKNRFDDEQDGLRERLDGTHDYDADDHIVENIKTQIGGRPRKIQAGEITKLEIKGKHSMVNALNDAISWGGQSAGGFDA